MKIRGGVFVALLLGAVSAQATTRVQKDFVARYPATAKTRLDACATCHSTPPALNPYGTALKAADLQFAAVEALDSDGDGGSNLTEIQALKQPGNARDQVAVKDTSAARPDTGKAVRDTTRAGTRRDTTKTSGPGTGAGAGVAGTADSAMAGCEALLKRHHQTSAEAEDLDARLDALVARMDAATGAARSTATSAAVRELAKQSKAHREAMTGLMGDVMAHMQEHMRNPNQAECPAAKAMATHGK